MKRFLTAALALSLLGGTAASAQSYNHDNRDNRDGSYQQGRHDERVDQRQADRQDRKAYKRWAKGQRLDRDYRADRYYVADYHRHGLRAPPRGYRWQRVDDNYVLASVATGLIASVILANR